MNVNATDNSLLSKYFECTNSKEHTSMTVVDGPSMRLSVQTLDGTQHSLPYSMLSHVRLVPGEDLTIEFTGGPTIVCRGVNLQFLFDALTQHSVATIQQADPLPGQGDHGVVILSLEVN